MSNKYGAIKAEEDGYVFDSLAERRRYRELKLMLDAGELSMLGVHPVFPLVVNGVKIGAYEGDFQYVRRDGVVVTEDVKGVRTAVYRLKKKLVKAIHGIEIVEVKA